MTSALLDMLAKTRQRMGGSRRAKTTKLPVGPSRWRILPAWDAAKPEVFYQEFGQHFIKNQLGVMVAVYMCVDKTYQKPCSICTAVSHAINTSTDDATLKVLNDAKATYRVLLNAVQVGAPGNQTAVILEVPVSVFDAIGNIINEHGEMALEIGKGVDFVINKTGAGMLTKYSVMPGAKATELIPSIMSGITNLADYVAQENEEMANRALSGLATVTGLLPPVVGYVPRHAGVLAAPHELRSISPSEPDISDVLVEDDETDEADQALRELEMGTVKTPEAPVLPVVEVTAPKKKAAAAAPAITGAALTPEMQILMAELGG